MNNSVATQDNNQISTQKKTFFTIEEGSNYVIRTSFDREYIVEFQQAQKIITSIFSTDADFITVNQTILNRKYIQAIEPTKEKTKEQLEEEERARVEIEKIGQRKRELSALKRASDAEFYNKKYGEGRWVIFKSPYKRGGSQHVIDEKDMRGAWDYFRDVYPSEADEIGQI